jgi:hypothetical protein
VTLSTSDIFHRTNTHREHNMALPSPSSSLPLAFLLVFAYTAASCGDANQFDPDRGTVWESQCEAQCLDDGLVLPAPVYTFQVCAGDRLSAYVGVRATAIRIMEEEGCQEPGLGECSEPEDTGPDCLGSDFEGYRVEEPEDS